MRRSGSTSNAVSEAVRLAASRSDRAAPRFHAKHHIFYYITNGTIRCRRRPKALLEFLNKYKILLTRRNRVVGFDERVVRLSFLYFCAFECVRTNVRVCMCECVFLCVNVYFKNLYVIFWV